MTWRSTLERYVFMSPRLADGREALTGGRELAKTNLKFGETLSQVLSFHGLLLCSFNLQVAKYPLHLQHSPGDPDLACLYRTLADGAQHLVLRGQPVLQVPVLLQGIQHHEILNLVLFLVLSLSPSLFFSLF